LLTVAGLVAFVRPEKVFSRESRFELAVGLIALSGFALQAGRGSIILMIAVAVAARWLYWGRPRVWFLFGAGLVGFCIIVFGFYLRTRLQPYLPLEAEIYGEVLPGLPFFVLPLVPIYLAVATNFLALQGVIGHFPTVSEFGNGAYNSIGLDLFFPGAQNISDLSAAITPPWVTSTVAGSLWADGGFLVVVLGVGLTGVLSVGTFAMAIKSGRLGWCLAAAYLLYTTVFGIYTNLWTQQVDWLMVAPLLLIAGFASERSGGAAGGAEGRSSATMGVVPSPQDDTKAPRDSKGGFSAKGALLLGVGTLAVLVITGLMIQRSLPEPIPESASGVLAGQIQTPAQVMTNGDLTTDNEPLYWVSPDPSGKLALSRREPTAEGQGTRLRTLPPTRREATGFDVADWPPFRDIALFRFDQRPRQLEITMMPSLVRQGRSRRFVAPIALPENGTRMDYFVATWEGTKPDLFVINRGSGSERVLIRILSGESGFRKQLGTSRLPFRGLSPGEWSIDIGSVFPQANDSGIELDLPDIVLVRHDPGKEYVDVQILLGETLFGSVAFQRDLELAGDFGSESRFPLGALMGSTAIYEIGPRSTAGDFRIGVFSLVPPVGFK
jgi:hypothetical protein